MKRLKNARITRDVVEGKGEPLYLRDGEVAKIFFDIAERIAANKYTEHR